MGTSVGRKKNNKKRIDNNNGQLSKYSTFDKINGRIIQGIKSIDQEIDSLQVLKNIFEKRSFEVLQNIVLDKSRISDIIAGKYIVEEDNIIIDSNLISLKTNFLNNQFLKSSSNFKILFSDDSVLLLKDIFNDFKVRQNCPECNITIEIRETLKICSNCYKTFHVKFLNEDSHSAKKWKYKSC